mmetsp:Transcript_20575/g.51177  ORF Transcript_20575/g.51177 Transcript_20575/m.51177 type:complete len:306 (+) Transcript_20575:61-978(+)
MGFKSIRTKQLTAGNKTAMLLGIIAIGLLMPTLNDIGLVLSFSTGLPKHTRNVASISRIETFIGSRSNDDSNEVTQSSENFSMQNNKRDDAPHHNKNRRMFFRDGGLAASTTAVSALGFPLVAAAKTDKSRTEGYAVQHTEREWAYLLSGAQYNILRRGGTERQKSSILNTYTSSNEGSYVCAGCQTPLFDSKDKFSSGTGWPSFARALEGVEQEEMDPISATLGGREVRCATCGGHLGDLFNDGWVYLGTQAFETGNRYCIDGGALIFKPQNGGEDVYGDLAPPNKVINYDSPMFRDNSVNSRL